MVNQRAPSGPVAIPHGLSMLACLKLLTLPPVEIRPIESRLVNQSAPSGPAVIPRGARMLACPKFVTAPSMEIRPIELPR